MRQQALRWLAVGALLVFAPRWLAAGEPSLSGQSGAAAPAEATGGFMAGACVHFTFGRGHLGDTLKMIRQAGVVSIRDEIPWGQVEHQKGRYQVSPQMEAMVDEAVAAGLQPLLILCYGSSLYAGRDFPSATPEAAEAFIRYGEYMVNKFKGRVTLFEFWNEWDYGTGMDGRRGGPEDYARLLKLAYPRLKAANPAAVIIAGAASDGGRAWAERVLQAGAIDFCDAFSFHPYTYKEGAVERRGAEYFAEVVGEYDRLLRSYNHGREKPMYITEMGYPTHAGPKGSTEDASAASLMKTFVMARSFSSVKGLWWYDFMDDGWNAREEEQCFGVVRPDLTPKRGWFALRDAVRVTNLQYAGRLEVGDPRIFIQKFRSRTTPSDETWVVWSAHEKDQWQLSLAAPAGGRPPVRIRPAGYDGAVRDWGTLEWAGTWKYEPAGISLCVSSYPWIIEGDLRGVTVGRPVRREAAPAGGNGNGGAMPVPNQIYLAARQPQLPAPMDFSAATDWETMLPKQAWGGREDLAASFSVGWEPRCLYLTVTVRDDVFCPQPGDRSWEGDSLQIGIFQTGNGAMEAGSWCEITAMLARQGPQLARTFMVDQRNNGQVNELDAGTARDGKTIVYRLRLDAATLGRNAFKAGDIVGLSLVVNDNDGQGRKGWLHWGGGMTKGKDAAQYNWVLLK